MKKKAESENRNEESKIEKQEEHIEATLSSEQPTKEQMVDNPEGSTTREVQISEERRANLTSPFHFLRNIKDEQVEYPVFLPKTSPASSDGPWISSLCHIADVLRGQGIPEQLLNVGLLSFIIANSPHLGNPMALELVDDQQSGVVNLLGACLRLIPDANKIELSDVSLATLVRERAQLKDRSIISLNAEPYKKNVDVFNLLLERQMLPWQETLTAKYGLIVQDILVEGPVGCVVVNKDSKRPILTHPSSIRVSLNPENPLQRPALPNLQPDLDEKDRENLEWHFALVKASIKRLRPAPVTIPFANQILKSLAESKVQHARQKHATFCKLISAITLVNTPPPVFTKELVARAIEFDVHKLASENRSVLDSGNNVVASKIDYYLFWLLMKDLIQSREDTLTERQSRVFEAIKSYNIGTPTQISTFAPQELDYQILLDISENRSRWASFQNIFERANQAGGEEINISTTYREIRELLNKELIQSHDDPGSKNKKLYSVTTLSVGQKINLPHPSEIDDPIFNRKPIQVVSPITGVIEAI